MSREAWDRARYEREKRNFIAARLEGRSVRLHVALIFTLTWLAGWVVSWALLRLGMASMPLRYAISFVAAYVAFIGCVRVWASAMQKAQGEGWNLDGLDHLEGTGSVGCAVLGVVAVVALVAIVLTTVFAAVGGLALLLEVAFELVFAGVVVRRIGSAHTLGDWLGTLLRNTWPHALGVLLVLLLVASGLQARAPEARTFVEAIDVMLKTP